MTSKWVQRAAEVAADVWATFKFVVACLISPIGTPVVAWRAMVNHARAKAEVGIFPAQVAALDAGLPLVGPYARVRRLDATQPLFITSDLHRCYPGRRDIPGLQRTKPLYAAILAHYERSDHHVVENGDVEDFWVVGGSPYGQWYDAARVATRLVPGRLGRELRRALRRRHLRLIGANNVEVGRVVRRLAEAGRYHRTVGNHDDVFLDPGLARDLAEENGGSAPVDFLVLDATGSRAAAIVTHGHQTDGWNAPGRSALGQLPSWVANTISDVPGLESPDAMLSRSATLAYLRGQLPNRLLQVNQRFGTNSKYDSLDEEWLFDAFGGATDSGPWLLMGHTHLPVKQPLSRTGVPWRRYANSGNGIWAGMITGLEWTGGPAGEPLPVAWVVLDGPDIEALVPEGATTIEVGERTVARVVMRPSSDGGHLEVDPERSVAPSSAADLQPA